VSPASIVEGIQELVATFNPQFQERLRHNIVLQRRRGGQMDGLNKRVEDGLASIGGFLLRIRERVVLASRC
jgi:hypothetical protein